MPCWLPAGVGALAGLGAAGLEGGGAAVLVRVTLGLGLGVALAAGEAIEVATSGCAHGPEPAAAPVQAAAAGAEPAEAVARADWPPAPLPR